MNKLSLIIATCLILIFAQTGAVLATEESSISAQQIKQETIDRIKRVLEEKLNIGREELGRSRLKAFIGQVDSLTETTMSVISRNGSDQTINKQVLATTETTIVRGGREIKFGDIGLSDQVIAMGMTTDDQTLSALRIVVETGQTPPTVTTHIVHGTISSLEGSTLTMDTTNSQFLGEEIIISRRAVIFDSQLEEIELDDLEIGMNLVAIVEIDSKQELNVSYRLMVFPESSTLAPTGTTTSTCGDNVCQNVVCSGIGCPTPETPQNCPADCSAE
jgi:hypothetical protein